MDLTEKYKNIVKCYIGCNEGWYPILDRLFAKISSIAEEKGYQIEICQIKEKMGGLRVYWDPVDGCERKPIFEDIEPLISEAEREAWKTCEYCGSTQGVSSNGPGWVKTLCSSCQDNRYEIGKARWAAHNKEKECNKESSTPSSTGSGEVQEKG